MMRAENNGKILACKKMTVQSKMLLLRPVCLLVMLSVFQSNSQLRSDTKKCDSVICRVTLKTTAVALKKKCKLHTLISLKKPCILSWFTANKMICLTTREPFSFSTNCDKMEQLYIEHWKRNSWAHRKIELMKTSVIRQNVKI